MPELSTIEISIETHRAIEAARKSFSETPNQILERVLGIHQETRPKLAGDSDHLKKGWSYSHGSESIFLPNGTRLRGEYRGHVANGVIENQKMLVEGTTFDSPSRAAIATFKTKSGNRTQLNGKIIWRCQLPNSNSWTLMKLLFKAS